MSETPLKLRSAIDTADGRDEMIIANWQVLAAAVWKGFLDEGRGGLLLDLKAAHEGSRWSGRKLVGFITGTGQTVQSRYLPIDVLRSEGNPDLQDMINYVENYDPTREMVLFIVSGDGDSLRCRCLHSESAQLLNPPDAYQAERSTHRNGPR